MSYDDNWPSAVEAEAHIRSELQRLGIPFKERRNGFALICPHPHPGTGPNTHFNFSVTKDGKGSSCFVCKPESQSWQKIAPILGAEKFHSSGLYTEETVDRELASAVRSVLAARALDDDTSEEPFGYVPPDMTPWVGSWRGLTEPFLQALHAHTWNQTFITQDGKVYCTPRIWFPFIQNSAYVGYTARRLDSLDKMKYFNAPWMKTLNTLYPLDYARRLGGKTIVVVEGPVDALKLLHAGIPAVSVLGTNNIGTKEAMLVACGYEKVFILFDNDDVGKLAAPVLHQRASKVMQSEILYLPEGIQDPGSMDQSTLQWLRQYVA